MATTKTNAVIRHLCLTALSRDGADRADAELLESFINQHDEAAFADLVRRHGPMVLGVCHRVVRNHHDAEDAFQATFLVLARKAASVRPRQMVAGWLHGVAYRTALKVRAAAAKRHVRETQVAEMPEPEAARPSQWPDLQPLLDQELRGLPENYRLPILLCDLEGKTILEATRQLGWPQGTLAGRLTRGRKLLAARLANRGVALSAGTLAAIVTQTATSAGVPTPLMLNTVKAATLIAAGQATAAGVVPAAVAAVTDGVITSMMLTKLKAAAVLLVLGTAAVGSGLLVRHTVAAPQGSGDAGGKPPATREADKPAKSPDEAKLQGEWSTENGGENARLVFGPNNSLRRIWESRPSEPKDVGMYLVDWSKTPYHIDVKWGNEPVWQTIMEFTDNGKLRIADGDDQTRPKAFGVDDVVFTKIERLPPGSRQAAADAEKTLATADFYRRAGKYGSAYFYYELVQYRYPEGDYAKRAKQGSEGVLKHRVSRKDGSIGWEEPEQHREPPPPPKMLPDKAVSQEIQELRQQVKDLEKRLAALEAQKK
ncbi:RNA polymerase sigma factor [Fimbriiglobus ruber]|uniref:High-affnity carbon uptake protein Hat/HatR n=1 Tax=Fimbriiglobus ruber TaxID=1908690 RepID=A0A225DML0_9BACT|nr:RNA polymerase sigma factor [Fimbriiglobus ruber]OWK42253.1 High-affnity carbon uptake protein Hat/HatR [Fimbriiglobus ruber]